MTAGDAEVEGRLAQLPRRSRRWQPLRDAVAQTLRRGHTEPLRYAVTLVRVDSAERRIAREIAGVAMARATMALTMTTAILPTSIATLRGDPEIADQIPSRLLRWGLDTASAGQTLAAAAAVLIAGAILTGFLLWAVPGAVTGRRDWVETIRGGWLAAAVAADVPLGTALRQADQIARGGSESSRWAEVASAIDRGAVTLDLPPVDPVIGDAIGRLAGGREPAERIASDLADWAWRRRVELRIAGRQTLRRIATASLASLTAGLLLGIGWAMLLPIVRGLQSMAAP